MRWLGDAAHMRQIRVLPETLKGRNFGRFKHRWEVNIEINQRSGMLKLGLNSG
jgi:hypothetical protein